MDGSIGLGAPDTEHRMRGKAAAAKDGEAQTVKRVMATGDSGVHGEVALLHVEVETGSEVDIVIIQHQAEVDKAVAGEVQTQYPAVILKVAL